MTFGEKVIKFNENVKYEGILPNGIRIMNPFVENPSALKTSSEFYRKFYNDENERILVLGINPGRLGAGVTGIPFTDTKRLEENCSLSLPNVKTYEPSAVFVYEVIEAFGGVKHFYDKFYINSVCPLGFVKVNEKGRETNYNYYDSKELQESVTDFIKWNIKTQIKLGVKTDVCYCLGSGKNFKFLNTLNENEKYFDKIIPLDHPRYVMQYKTKQKAEYVRKFVELLT